MSVQLPSRVASAFIVTFIALRGESPPFVYTGRQPGGVAAYSFSRDEPYTHARERPKTSREPPAQHRVNSLLARAAAESNLRATCAPVCRQPAGADSNRLGFDSDVPLTNPSLGPALAASLESEFIGKHGEKRD